MPIVDLGLLQPGAIVSLSGVSDGGVDVYSFVVPQNLSLPLIVSAQVTPSSGSTFDPYVRIFDPDVTEIAWNDDGEFDSVQAQAQAELFEPGRYYVGVSGAGNALYSLETGAQWAGSQGAYEFQLTADDVSHAASAFEPNDDSALASFMGGGSFEVLNEYIGDGDHRRRDVDIYRLRLDQPARLDVHLVAKAIGSTLDPALRIRTCGDSTVRSVRGDACLVREVDDEPLTTADVHTSVAISRNALVEGPPEPIDVYLIVSGSGNLRPDPAISGSGTIGSTGRYDLQVEVTPYAGDGPFEPNDSIQLATPAGFALGPGRPMVRTFDAVIGDGPMALGRGDQDVYRVVLSAVDPADSGRWLSVGVDSQSRGGQLDAVVEVFDATGRLLAQHSGGTSDPTLRVPISSNGLLDAESYFIVVRGAGRPVTSELLAPGLDSQRPDDFVVATVPASTGTYLLTLSIEPGTDDCGQEPNDTLATATDTGLVDFGEYFCAGTSLQDHQCEGFVPGDLDLWSFVAVHPPVRVRASAVFHGEEVSEAGLLLLNELGEIVERQGEVFDAVVDGPGRYYLAAAENVNFTQPGLGTVPCQGDGVGADAMTMYIRLTDPGDDLLFGRQQPPAYLEPGPNPVESTELWALHSDVFDDAIFEVQAGLGSAIPSPEVPLSGSEALAFNGTALYMLGTGRYPALYQLDSTTGDVLDTQAFDAGSGYYSDMTFLGGELFLLDYVANAIHVVDPAGRRFLRTLAPSAEDVRLNGGLAALAGPGRLFAADALGSGALVEVHPRDGSVTRILPGAGMRALTLAGLGSEILFSADWLNPAIELFTREGDPIEDLPMPAEIIALASQATAGYLGDFQADGNIDLKDAAAFQNCVGSSTGETPACGPADGSADGTIGLDDLADFAISLTGP